MPIRRGIEFTPNGEINQELQTIKGEIQKSSVNVTLDAEERVNEFGRYMRTAAHFNEAINKDRVKEDTKTSYAFTSTPERLRDAILCRMFGEHGEEAPHWWPEALREKVRPRMRQIMTNTVSTTNIHYTRVCPHQGDHGHANFLFGPDIAFAERGMKNDLYKAAEKAQGKDLISKLYELMIACSKSGYEPRMISLGRHEMHQFFSSVHHELMMQGEPTHRGNIEEWNGLRIEEVDRDTYLSIC